MIRGYAIGQGAGTQALTALLWLLFFGALSELTRELLMGASWALNFAVAEWIIHHNRSKGRQASERLTSDGHAERCMTHP